MLMVAMMVETMAGKMAASTALNAVVEKVETMADKKAVRSAVPLGVSCSALKSGGSSRLSSLVWE